MDKQFSEELKNEASEYAGSNYTKNHQPALYDARYFAFLAGATSSSIVKNLEREVERLKEVIKELYYCPAIKNAMKVFSMNIDDEYNKFKTENNL